MSNHFTCRDCCKYQTDACDNPKYAESGKHLCPTYVLDIEQCYQKGYDEAIDEVIDLIEEKIVSAKSEGLVLTAKCLANINAKLKEQRNE